MSRHGQTGGQVVAVRIGGGRKDRKYFGKAAREEDVRRAEALLKARRASPRHHGTAYTSDDLYYDFRCEKESSHSWKRSSADVNNSRYNLVSKRIGELPVDDIDRPLVNAVLIDLQKDHDPGYVDDVRVLLRAMFEYAVKTGKLYANPVPKERIRKTRKTVRRMMSDAELDRFSAWLAESPDGFEQAVSRSMAAAILLLALRPCEVAGLRWDNVSFRRGVVHVCENIDKNGEVGDCKTHEARTLPLGQMAERLADLKSAQEREGIDSDYVFPMPNGRRRYPFEVSKVVTEAFADLGIEGFEPYGLRGMGATLMADAGVPLKDIQRFLGHKAPNMTLQYYQFSADAEAEGYMTAYHQAIGA